MKEIYRKLLVKLIVIVVLTVCIVVLSVVKQWENVAEWVFARGISRGYMLVMGNIAAVFPFSLFDVFVTVGILALLVSIGFFIYHLKKKRKWLAIGLVEKLAIAALSVALLYTMVAGGNYYRTEVPLERYEGEQLSNEKTAELVGVLLDDFSAVSAQMERREDGTTISPYTFQETVELIRKEYEKLDDDYFSSYVPSAKEGWYSKFLTSEGITGITFTPTGDAVVNAETPDCYKVVTTAHEIAHAVGCMREGDANLMAYYVLLKSDIPYFRYCAYMYSLGHVTEILWMVSPDLYRDVIRKYPNAARIERTAEDSFWETKYSFMDDVGEFLNDVYLKLSGAEDGTDSYHDYSDITVVYDDDNAVEDVRVNYSLTTRVILRIAQERSAQTK